jgi:phenylacetate-coenzyme A ligase PaaK-like adenylate-forming protein
LESQWNDKIFNVAADDFEPAALEAFRFQYKSNLLYKAYIDALHINVETVKSIMQIPFLPIRFFKTYQVKTGQFKEERVFASSGTTGSIPSYHYIKDLCIYEESFSRCFELNYGPVNDWCIIGLLPSYLERGNSSLVYMVDHLVRKTSHPASGFYLDEFERLAEVLKQLSSSRQKTILIGVTFALLDFAERFPFSLPDNIIIMETGGMKGRREEITRMEVHDILKTAFGLSSIHSEYGMTELLSQAYSRGDGLFRCPPWMKVVVRDDEDPLEIIRPERRDFISGAINIIDLANIYSCSFIAADDAGKLYRDGSFEVLGRIDNSDIRGCSLLAV